MRPDQQTVQRPAPEADCKWVASDITRSGPGAVFIWLVVSATLMRLRNAMVPRLVGLRHHWPKGLMAEKNTSNETPVLTAEDELSTDDLIKAAYPELKRMARRQLRRESGQAFQTTELVNEAVMRWFKGQQAVHSPLAWMAIMAKVMRNVLVDEARSRHAKKRGENPRKITINLNAEPADEPTNAYEILDLETALIQLHALDARKASVIECHYFGGMTVREMAAHFAVGEATIKRDLITARAWIGSQITS